MRKKNHIRLKAIDQGLKHRDIKMRGNNVSSCSYSCRTSTLLFMRPTRGQGGNPGPVPMEKPFTGAWDTEERTVSSQVLPVHLWPTTHLSTSPGLCQSHSLWGDAVPPHPTYELHGGSSGIRVEALEHKQSVKKHNSNE